MFGDGTSTTSTGGGSCAKAVLSEHPLTPATAAARQARPTDPRAQPLTMRRRRMITSSLPSMRSPKPRSRLYGPALGHSSSRDRDAGGGWVVEDGGDGRRLVVTGRWSATAAQALASGDVDELWPNSARGFSEPTLDFIEDWPLTRLVVIARGIDVVSPVERLRSLRKLSVQASARARLDLSRLPLLRELFAFSPLVDASLAVAEQLERLQLHQSRAETVAAIPLPETLLELELIDSSRLTVLAGVERLDRPERLTVALAPHIAFKRSSEQSRSGELEGLADAGSR